MAGALRFQGWSLAGVASPSAVFAFDAQISYVSTPGAEELALEYDIKINTMAPGPFDQMGFVDFVESGGAHLQFAPDQEGRAAYSIAGVDALVARAKGNWYRRVIRIPQTVSPRTYSQWRVGFWGNYPGSRFPGVIDFEITNVRLTNFRETVFWFWREGMAVPAFVSNTNIGANFSGGTPTVTAGVIAAPELPSYCSKASNQMLDDISHQRRAGGRLNSWAFWDGPSASFTLTGIRLTEQQRWDLEAFYSVFRRDAFVYRHQANLPGVWCRFEKPPKFDDNVDDQNQLTYDTTISLLRRGVH